MNVSINVFIFFFLCLAAPYYCTAQDIEKTTRDQIASFQQAINQLSQSSKYPNDKQINSITKQFFVQGSKIEDNITSSGNALSPKEYIGKFCLNEGIMNIVFLNNTILYENRNGIKITKQRCIFNIATKNGTSNNKSIFELNKGIITRIASENSPLLSTGGKEIRQISTPPPKPTTPPKPTPPVIAQVCDCTKDKNKICLTLGIKPKGKQTCEQAIKAILAENTPCPQCEQCPPPPPRPIINKDSIFSALCAQFVKNNPQLGILPPLTNNRDAYETAIRNRIQDLYEDTKINLDFKNAEKPLNQIVEQLSEDFDLGKRNFEPNANNSSVTVNNKTSETLIEGLYGQVEDLNNKLDLARPVDIKVYFIANETAKRGKKGKKYFKEDRTNETAKKEKKEKIYLTKEGLSRAEYRKYKDSSVKTIYVEFPIQKELFPEGATLDISGKNGEKDIYKYYNLIRSQKEIKFFNVSSLNFPKAQIEYESTEVVINIHFGNLNLIKNANGCPDEEGRKTCYKFIIYKDENNTLPYIE